MCIHTSSIHELKNLHVCANLENVGKVLILIKVLGTNGNATVFFIPKKFAGHKSVFGCTVM